MTKVFFKTVIALFFCSCCLTKQNSLAQTSALSIKGDFLIKKIDQKNDSVFVIYASKSDTLFKIVSFKKEKRECSSIEVGKVYNLSLRSLLAMEGVPHEYLTPQSLGFLVQQLSGMIYHGTSISFEKDKMLDNIFEVLNLNGLCPNDEVGNVSN